MGRESSSPRQVGDATEHEPSQDILATAFGLDVHCAIPLSFLQGTSADPTGRKLSVSVQAPEAGKLPWPESAELACKELQPDGSEVFRIESHPEAGYLIAGPEYGANLLSSDGRSLRCAPEDHPEGAWQRLLVAQALPFAALLHGLEVLHASAVVRDETAVAFLGPSRSGKTSLALELCNRGACFLADDVLAVESRGQELIAHPGTAVAGVDRDRPEPLRATNVDSPEELVAINARERLLRMQSASNPRPLSALFFLDRRADGPERPRFETAADAQMLLAATFNFVLATPQRLRGLLDVCAHAARLRVERIITGPDSDTAEVGTAVERRLSSPP
jgi:hypothetical protein